VSVAARTRATRSRFSPETVANDYPLGCLLRDAKLYEIGADTSEIRRMLIGRELFEKSP
jgi:alkylation response protein AidB-like acyl-CoA dehydrogenase